MEKFDLAPVFSVEEFEHWFLPQSGIINSFVVEKEGKITDMVSYYTLPSSIMHHQTHKTLKAAYSFYNVSTVTPWLELMMDALISARDVSLFRIFIMQTFRIYTITYQIQNLYFYSWVSMCSTHWISWIIKNS